MGSRLFCTSLCFYRNVNSNLITNAGCRLRFAANTQFHTEKLKLYGTFPRHKHDKDQKYTKINSKKTAQSFIGKLDNKGRELLQEELTRITTKRMPNAGQSVAGLLSGQSATPDPPAEPPADLVDLPADPGISRTVLWQVFLFNAIPFVGFGMLDNFIMIIAGEYIDLKLGAVLGISTMAAAALGNLISDIAGVGTAGYIESLCGRAGLSTPDLTMQQHTMWQTRWTTALGRGIGVSIGCVIGMFPLLFMHNDDEESDEDKGAKEDTDKPIS